MIVYSGATIAGQQPYDICFPPRGRLLSDAPGARAAYAADDRVAVVTDGTLHILADDPELDAPGEVIATLPCPGHDEVFTVRYGHSVLTAGPEGCGAPPRLFEIAGAPALRGEVPASGASRDFKARLKEQGGVITGVRHVIHTHGRYFIWTHRLGRYEICGVDA